MLTWCRRSGRQSAPAPCPPAVRVAGGSPRANQGEGHAALWAPHDGQHGRSRSRDTGPPMMQPAALASSRDPPESKRGGQFSALEVLSSNVDAKYFIRAAMRHHARGAGDEAGRQQTKQRKANQAGAAARGVHLQCLVINQSDLWWACASVNQAGQSHQARPHHLSGKSSCRCFAGRGWGGVASWGRAQHPGASASSRSEELAARGGGGRRAHAQRGRDLAVVVAREDEQALGHLAVLRRTSGRPWHSSGSGTHHRSHSRMMLFDGPPASAGAHDGSAVLPPRRLSRRDGEPLTLVQSRHCE